jgi:hypothetical protein
MSLGIFRAFVRPDTRVAFDDLRLWDAFKKSLTGKRVVITIEREVDARTRLQEKGFHSAIQPWARERGWQIADLKRFLLGRIFGYQEQVSTLTGERLLVQPHTSKLSKEDYSFLIDQTLILAAEDGYVLVAPDEFRAVQPDRYPVREKTRRVA